MGPRPIFCVNQFIVEINVNVDADADADVTCKQGFNHCVFCHIDVDIKKLVPFVDLVDRETCPPPSPEPTFLNFHAVFGKTNDQIVSWCLAL